jgi:hypothetical protein
VLYGVQSLPNRRDHTAISNKNLSHVARAVVQECIQLLAEELDFLSEFTQLRTNNHPNNIHRFTFTMLEHWCDEQLHAGIALDEIVKTLSQKLVIADCLDAAFQLHCFIGSVIESKDLMRLAKIIPPDKYYSLGVLLDIKITELERIRVNNSNDVLTATILMLDLWCRRALRDSPTLDTMVNNLSAALSEDGLNSVACKLIGYAENKCLHEEDYQDHETVFKPLLTETTLEDGFIATSINNNNDYSTRKVENSKSNNKRRRHNNMSCCNIL